MICKITHKLHHQVSSFKTFFLKEQVTRHEYGG